MPRRTISRNKTFSGFLEEERARNKVAGKKHPWRMTTADKMADAKKRRENKPVKRITDPEWMKSAERRSSNGFARNINRARSGRGRRQSHYH